MHDFRLKIAWSLNISENIHVGFFSRKVFSKYKFIKGLKKKLQFQSTFPSTIFLTMLNSIPCHWQQKHTSSFQKSWTILEFYFFPPDAISQAPFHFMLKKKNPSEIVLTVYNLIPFPPKVRYSKLSAFLFFFKLKQYCNNSQNHIVSYYS